MKRFVPIFVLLLFVKTCYGQKGKVVLQDQFTDCSNTNVYLKLIKKHHKYILVANGQIIKKQFVNDRKEKDEMTELKDSVKQEITDYLAENCPPTATPDIISFAENFTKRIDVEYKPEINRSRIGNDDLILSKDLNGHYYLSFFNGKSTTIIEYNSYCGKYQWNVENIKQHDGVIANFNVINTLIDETPDVLKDIPQVLLYKDDKNYYMVFMNCLTDQIQISSNMYDNINRGDRITIGKKTYSGIKRGITIPL